MKPVYLAIAGLCFALAVLGAFLPVLPTTPFLLLTSWALVRSSPRLDAKLRATPLFGPFLRDWDRYHGVRLHVKVAALTVLALVVAASLIFGNLPPWLALLLVVLAAIGATVVLHLRTIDPDSDEP